MRSADLEYFKLVVESGSLTKAAGFHGARVSTFTRAIDRLEDELGVTLLERNYTGITLTGAGDLLFQRIATLLDDLNEVRALCELLGTGRRGVIRIGSLLPPIGKRFEMILSQWKQDHPNIGIKFYEIGTRDLRSSLFRRRIDVIFFTPYGQSNAIESLPFYSEDLFVSLPSSHRLREREALEPHDLQGETFLLQDWGGDYSLKSRYIDILGKDITFESHPAGKQSVLTLVSAGYGVTLAVRSQAEHGFPGVIFRPLQGKNARLPISLGWDANRQDPVTGRFVAFIRDFVRQH